MIAAAGRSGRCVVGRARAKIAAAADYLTRAPTVVEVVRDLDLPADLARIGLRMPDVPRSRA